jgi:HK97 family phage major capsid protein
MTGEETVKALRELTGELGKLRAEGVITKAVLDKHMGELEARVLQRIPAGERVALHAEAKADRKRMAEQLRFMLDHDARKFTKDSAELRALGVSTGEGGGFTVPEDFMAEVVRKQVKAAVIRPLARVFSGVGKKGVLPRETGTVTMSWENENVAGTESTNPKFGQVAWNLNKLKGLTKISNELLNGSGVDVVAILTDMFAEQGAIEEDKQFMNGLGAAKPLGIRNTTGVGSTTQTGANLAYADFVKAKHALPSQYRNNAIWLLHNDILSLTAKIIDLQGRPIFLDMSTFGGQGTNQNIPANTIGFLLGMPVVEQNDIPVNLGGGGNESEIWLADLNYYGIFDQGTMEISSTTEGFGTFESDQIAVKMLQFVDGKILQPEAFLKLTGVK